MCLGFFKFNILKRLRKKTNEIAKLLLESRQECDCLSERVHLFRQKSMEAITRIMSEKK